MRATVRRSLRAIRLCDRGQVVILMPLFLFIVMIGGTMIVDIGQIVVERRSAQAAADFSALAAAQELPRSASDPNTAAKLATATLMAQDYLRFNNFDPADPDVTVTITPAFEGDVTQIEVTVSRNHKWIFAGFFGVAPAAVTARAVAETDAHQRDVVVVLDRSGSMCLDSHGGPMLKCPKLDEGERWEPFDTMRDAAKDFTNAFEPEVFGLPFDHLALVTYSTDANLDVSLTIDFGQTGTAFGDAVDLMEPAGRTNIGHALFLARKELKNGNGAIQAIVLLTDGLANIANAGSDDNPSHKKCSSSKNCAGADNYVLAQATLAAADGIALYTIGLTDNSGDGLVKQVAQIGFDSGGGGAFFDVSDPSQLSETFEQIANLITLTLTQ